MKNRNTVFTTILLMVGCLAFLPLNAFAVVPAPDGGYPGNNTAEGQSALLSLTTGINNTAVGWMSLRSVTEGQLNTAVGSGALSANAGNLNTATGGAALFSNNSGFDNTASGALALFHNITGPFNTANGAFALFGNTTGYSNTAVGSSALISNTVGYDNTATGINALFSNIGGFWNTAIGSGALFSNTANGNTATGFHALYGNTTGDDNTANGDGALAHNTLGYYNTAIGAYALYNSTGGSNTALGYHAGGGVTTAGGVICIGADGANVSNSCFIGNIFGALVAIGAVPVMVDSNGQLGTQMSSRRFKKEIKPIGQASETILALKPVTFHYKSDPAGAGPQFGLIAEEVAEVNPDLVVRDKNGEIYTVRYDAVNAMLLNEFLKEHRKVDQQGREIHQQQATIAELKATVAQQQKDFQAKFAGQETQIKALAADLQRVSAQVEVSRPAPKVVSKAD
jgi:trimeric autotransporter adhesin